MVGFLCFKVWGDGGGSMKRVFTIFDPLGVWPRVTGVRGVDIVGLSGEVLVLVIWGGS